MSSKSVRWRGDASTTRGTNGTGAIDGSAFGLAAFCFGADDLAGRAPLIHLIQDSIAAACRPPVVLGSNQDSGSDKHHRYGDDHQVDGKPFGYAHGLVPPT